MKSVEFCYMPKLPISNFEVISCLYYLLILDLCHLLLSLSQKSQTSSQIFCPPQSLFLSFPDLCGTEKRLGFGEDSGRKSPTTFSQYLSFSGTWYESVSTTRCPTLVMGLKDSRFDSSHCPWWLDTQLVFCSDDSPTAPYMRTYSSQAVQISTRS